MASTVAATRGMAGHGVARSGGQRMTWGVTAGFGTAGMGWARMVRRAAATRGAAGMETVMWLVLGLVYTAFWFFCFGRMLDDLSGRRDKQE